MTPFPTFDAALFLRSTGILSAHLFMVEIGTLPWMYSTREMLELMRISPPVSYCSELRYLWLDWSWENTRFLSSQAREDQPRRIYSRPSVLILCKRSISNSLFSFFTFFASTVLFGGLPSSSRLTSTEPKCVGNVALILWCLDRNVAD